MPVAMLQQLGESVAASAARLGLEPISLPADIAAISALSGEETVSMVSLAWRGGPFRMVRTTLMESPNRINVFNLVAYPHVRFASPVFATDIVVLRDQLRIGVIDAMPLFPEDADYTARWVAPFRPLAEKSRAMAPRFELKMEWSRHYLGEGACLATGLRADGLADLTALWEEYWASYLARCEAEPPASPQVAAETEAWHLEYNRDHAAVELKRNPLVRYYGAEYGARFIAGFLFSDTLGLGPAKSDEPPR